MGGDDQLLKRNLDALSARLGAQVALDGAAGRFSFEPGAAPALLVRSDSGEWLSVHSRRDAMREASQQFQQAAGTSPDPHVVACIGAGLGFILDVVATRTRHSKIVAIEPDESSVRALLSRSDWSELMATERLTVLWGPSFVGAAGAWRQFRALGIDGEPIVIVNAALARGWPAAVESGRRCLARILNDQRANERAAMQFAGPYLLNTLSNLPIIARSGDVTNLAGLFTGIPAVLAAAGPSLDDNIAGISAMRSRALIIAVDTALRPLLEAGIEPHFVVAVDPGEANARHLTNLPACPGTALVAEGSVHPSAFEHFSDRVFVFQVSNHQPWPWLSAHGVARGQLRAWGSVLTSAFDLAVRLGCDPIAFTGADLAYTGGRPYCRGTVYEQDWARAVARGEELPEIWRTGLALRKVEETPDLRGGSTGSTPFLMAFRAWLADEAAARRDRRLVNCTGEGILYGPGLEQDSLESVLGDRPPLADPVPLIRHASARTTDGDIEPAGARLVPHLAALGRSDGPQSRVIAEWASFGHLAPETVVTAAAETAATLAGESRESNASGRLSTARGVPDGHPLPRPEVVRRWRATLLGEALPAWAQPAGTAAGTPGDDGLLLEQLPIITLLHAGEHFERLGRFAKASAMYDRAVRRAVAVAESDWLRPARLGLLRSLYLDGRFRDALALLAELTELSDEPFVIQCGSSIRLFQFPDDEAFEYIRGAIARHPDAAGPRLNLAARLAMTGDLRSALELVDSEEPRWTDPVIPTFVRGICYRAGGRPVDAMRLFDSLVPVFPTAAIEHVVAAFVARDSEVEQRALASAVPVLAGQVVVAFINVPPAQAASVDEALAELQDQLAHGGTRLDASAISPHARRALVAPLNP